MTFLQDAFVKMWKHADRFDPHKRTFFTWMLNITRNTAIDYHRAKLVRGTSVSFLTITENELYRRQTSKLTSYQQTELRGFVDSLPIKLSTVIKLVYFDGHTMEEVAIKLSVPLGTIKSRVRKALNELREIYDEQDQVHLHAA